MADDENVFVPRVEWKGGENPRRVSGEKRRARLVEYERFRAFHEANPRPETRGDCVGGERPCPYVSCKYHLYLDVHETTGTVTVNRPDVQVWEMDESCALDVADAAVESGEGCSGQTVATMLGLTRAGVDLILKNGLSKLRHLPVLSAYKSGKEVYRELTPETDGGYLSRADMAKIKEPKLVYNGRNVLTRGEEMSRKYAAEKTQVAPLRSVVPENAAEVVVEPAKVVAVAPLHVVPDPVPPRYAPSKDSKRKGPRKPGGGRPTERMLASFGPAPVLELSKLDSYASKDFILGAVALFGSSSKLAKSSGVHVSTISAILHGRLNQGGYSKLRLVAAVRAKLEGTAAPVFPDAQDAGTRARVPPVRTSVPTPLLPPPPPVPVVQVLPAVTEAPAPQARVSGAGVLSLQVSRVEAEEIYAYARAKGLTELALQVSDALVLKR